MAATTPQPAKKHLRLSRRWRRGLAIAVWLAAVAGVWRLGGQLPLATAIHALADSTQAEVRSPMAGLVSTMAVRQNDVVTAGMVLGRLDDVDVRLRLAAAQAEIEGLRAELAAEQADREFAAREAAAEHQLDLDGEHRRRASNVEVANVAALATRTRLEETRVRLQSAAIAADRQLDLTRLGFAGWLETTRLDYERRALQKVVTELEALLEAHRARVAAAEQRLREFAPTTLTAPTIDVALAPLRSRIAAQTAIVERLAHEARQLDLRAPIAGRVTSLGAHAGEWVPAGISVVTITDPRPSRLRGYVPERAAASLRTLQHVQVHRDRSSLGSAPVLGVSPNVVQLPERLWRDPRQAEWGYELLVAATGAELPGERLLLSQQP